MGDALHRVGGLLDDYFADCSLPVQKGGFYLDVGMLHERRTAVIVAEAGNDVDNARRKAAIGEVVGKFQCGQRRLFGRL